MLGWLIDHADILIAQLLGVTGSTMMLALNATVRLRMSARKRMALSLLATAMMAGGVFYLLVALNAGHSLQD